MTRAAFQRHFSSLASQYGEVVIVNLLGSSLVGSKEGEAVLSTAYQQQQQACPSTAGMQHTLWDWHGEGGAKANAL